MTNISPPPIFRYTFTRKQLPDLVRTSSANSAGVSGSFKSNSDASGKSNKKIGKKYKIQSKNEEFHD
jgi:hypothetical protein